MPHEELLPKLRRIGISGCLWKWLYICPTGANLYLVTPLLTLYLFYLRSYKQYPWAHDVLNLHQWPALNLKILFHTLLCWQHQMSVKIGLHRHLLLQHDMINNWRNKWNNLFNELKSVLVTYCRGIQTCSCEYYINNVLIICKESTRDLGVIMSLFSDYFCRKHCLMTNLLM